MNIVFHETFLFKLTFRISIYVFLVILMIESFDLFFIDTKFFLYFFNLYLIFNKFYLIAYVNLGLDVFDKFQPTSYRPFFLTFSFFSKNNKHFFHSLT